MFFLNIKFLGECEQCLNNSCPILSQAEEINDEMFVCDQNGETKSKCEFEMLRCIYKLKFGYNITRAYASFYKFSAYIS